MKKLRWIPLALSLFSCSMAHAALVGQRMSYIINGSACVAAFGSDGMISYGPFGAHNTSATSVANIICPLTSSLPSLAGVFASTPNSAGNCTCDLTIQPTLGVYDRSLTDDVSCSLVVLNSDGTVFQSWSAASSGFASSMQTLTFPTGCTANWAPPKTLALMCSVPATTSVGFSHVTTMYIPFCGVQSIAGPFP